MFAFYENWQTGLYAVSETALDFPLHLHESLELLYLERGSMTVQVDDTGYALASGGLAVIFPSRIHGYRTHTARDETLLRIAVCGQEMTGGFAGALRGSHPGTPVLEASQVHGDIPYAMDGLVTACRGREEAAVGGAFVQLILARSLPLTALLRNGDRPESALAVRAVRYLTEHFLEPVTLESAARALGVCRYSLSRALSQGLGMGFCRYVQELRVRYARNLLENTDRSMLEVGLDSGFDNQRTFNRVFGRLCGTTPGRYRQRHTGSFEKGDRP